MKIGFDHEKYLEEQSKYILERVNNHDKLYIEFGGKLLGDLHAKRVLPGFDENAKIKVLNKLKDKIEVIICVYAGDIERNKIRGDFGITYDMDVFRLIDDLRTFVTKNDKKNILSFSTIIDSHTNISTPSKEEFLDCVYKVFNFLRALYENDNAKLLLDNIYPILVKSFFAPLRNDDKIKYDYNQDFIYALEYTQIIIEVMDEKHE